MKSRALTALAVVALTLVTACGGAVPQGVPARPPENYIGQIGTTDWPYPTIPIPFGMPGCTEKGPGFQPPLEAVTCDVYNGVKEFLGQAQVKGGTYYCSIPAGYVRCTDAQGKHINPESTRGMCGFDGPEPTCSDVDETTDPNAPADIRECPNDMPAPTPPDPT